MPVSYRDYNRRKKSACAVMGNTMFIDGGIALDMVDEQMYSNINISLQFLDPKEIDSELSDDWITLDTISSDKVYSHTISTYKYYIYSIGGISFDTSTIISTVKRGDVVRNSNVDMSCDTTRPRYEHQSAIYNNKIYLFGGRDSSGNVLNVIDSYDMEDNTQTYNVFTGGTARREFSISFDIRNNTVYLIGGINSSGNVIASVEMYSFEDNTIYTKASLPIVLTGHSSGYVNKKIYVFNGMSGTDSSTATYNTKSYEYDIMENSQTKINTNIYPRVWGSAHCVDGSFSIYNGQSSSQSYIDHNQQIFSIREKPATEYKSQSMHKFVTDDTKFTNDQTSSLFHRGLVYENKLYVSYSKSNNSGGFEVLNLDTNTQEAPLSDGTNDNTIGFSFLYYNHKFYKYGGGTNLGIYDISTAIQTNYTTTVDRTHHCAAIYNGKMYVFGGINSDNYMQQYDISNNSQSGGSVGDHTGYNYSEMIAYNNKLYIFGGYRSGDSIIIYNISTDTFSTLTSTVPLRYGQRGILDGTRFYLCGGKDNTDDYIIPLIDVFDLESLTQVESIPCPLYSATLSAYTGRFNPIISIYNKNIYVQAGIINDSDGIPMFIESYKYIDEPQTIKFNMDGYSVSNEDEIYKLNPVTGNFSKVETSNTPSGRFGHGSSKIGSDSFYVIGGALDKSMIDINSLPLFENKYEKTLIQDTSSYVEYINDVTEGDWGLNVTSGYYVRIPVDSGSQVKNICVEVNGGSVCTCILHNDATTELYHDLVSFPIIIDITSSGHTGPIFMQLDVPSQTKIKSILISS